MSVLDCKILCAPDARLQVFTFLMGCYMNQTLASTTRVFVSFVARHFMNIMFRSTLALASCIGEDPPRPSSPPAREPRQPARQHIARRRRSKSSPKRKVPIVPAPAPVIVLADARDTRVCGRLPPPRDKFNSIV